jgi:integrase
VDFDSKVIRLDNDVKTPASVEPIPLSEYACDVFKAWNREQGSRSTYIFPSPIFPDRPISTVKTAWHATLRRAGVPRFPLYTLRQVFCTRLSEVAPDAVVQRAMRHSSPETKRRYQLGMADQVREAVEKANTRLHGRREALHLRDSRAQTETEVATAVCN